MGLIQSLFGGSSKKEESSSGNQAYPYLISNFGGWPAAGTNALGAMTSLLGIGGGGGPTAGWTIDMEDDGIPGNAGTSPDGTYTIPGAPGSGYVGGPGGSMGGSGDAMGGFNNFLNSSGYNFIQDEAMSGLKNMYGGMGMYRSGPAMKAVQDRAANIGKTYFDNYLNHLTDVSKLSLGAGGLIGDAGQWSKGSASGSESTGGLGKAIGSLFSDPELKTNVVKVGEFDDGLEIVEFDYRQDTGLDLPKNRFRGVMADQVAALRPWALGPLVNGYLTVDYTRLEAR